MQNMPPDQALNQADFTAPGNAASGSPSSKPAPANPQPPTSPPSFFYTQDQEDEFEFSLPPGSQDDPQGPGAPFMLPFESSAGMPTLTQVPAQGSQRGMGTPPTAPPPGRKSRPPIRLLLIVGVVLTATVFASLLVFAQLVPSPRFAHTSPAPVSTTASHSLALTASPTRKTQTKAPAASHPQPATPGTEASPSGNIPSAQALSQLGWTQAGLSEGDAIEALRTGETFTDREMSYDYRNIGTPAQHGGTLIAATFLLTSGGLVRFTHNDVRMINNVLYDKISTGKIIQQVVNATPSLVRFQTEQIQGKFHQFAWVNVAFELFQSKIDPASGKRQEGMEQNPTTGQPMLHHLVIVLLRVPPQTQGTNAPMGGTGWLVNTYELDPGTLPAVVTDPSL